MYLKSVHYTGKASNNVAEGKPSSQSSTYKVYEYGKYINATSDLAVDGIWESKMRHDQKFSCTHTASASSGDHWWTVNLEQTCSVSKVVILNRGDCCCKYIARY